MSTNENLYDVMFAYNTRASKHSGVGQFIDHIKIKVIPLDVVVSSER